MKIDIEGFETKAFRGFAKNCSSAPPTHHRSQGSEWMFQTACIRTLHIEMLPHFHPVAEIAFFNLLLKVCWPRLEMSLCIVYYFYFFFVCT